MPMVSLVSRLSVYLSMMVSMSASGPCGSSTSISLSGSNSPTDSYNHHKYSTTSVFAGWLRCPQVLKRRSIGGAIAPSARHFRKYLRRRSAPVSKNMAFLHTRWPKNIHGRVLPADTAACCARLKSSMSASGLDSWAKPFLHCMTAAITTFAQQHAWQQCCWITSAMGTFLDFPRLAGGAAEWSGSEATWLRQITSSGRSEVA